MLLLTGTSDAIKVITNTAVTSIQVHASWVDISGGVVTPGRTNTAITTATTTIVVASPAASTQRNVKTLNVYNSSASQCQVTIQHTDGTTAVSLVKVLLNTLETLEYVEGQGLVIYDARGSPKNVNQAEMGYTLRSITYITTTGSGTYTVPANTRALYVTCIGAGGGGGGATRASNNCGMGAGGGGGGTSRALIFPSLAETYAVNVGAGGSSGANTGASGGTGGDTTFGSVCTGKGGLGGAGMTSGTSVAVSLPGGGGPSSSGVGDVKLDGAAGVNGLRLSGTVGGAGCGGQATLGGGGGLGKTVDSAGANGGQYGGGAAGASSLSSNQAGGTGAQGLIIVEELS